MILRSILIIPYNSYPSENLCNSVVIYINIIGKPTINVNDILNCKMASILINDLYYYK